MTNSSDAPKPGTHEYDQMMIDKFRNQPGARKEEPIGDPSYHHVLDIPNGSATPSSISVRSGSTFGPRPEGFTAEQANPNQIRELERKAANLRDAIERNAGNAEMVRGLRVQLAHVEQVALPYAKDVQREAAQWRAENVPTTEQKLEERLAQREAIRGRALQIADEREAEVLADRITAQRRTND